MKRRYLVYGSVIAALVLVNLVRWSLPGGPGGDRSAARGTAWAAQDFRLRANVPAAREARRNLFAPQAAAPAAARVTRPVRPAPIARPAAPLVAPADMRSATAPLGRLRLLGVVFREGHGQAYLALEKDSVLARRGDTVFGHFTVDKVTVDAVELSDLEKKTTRRIPVSGR